MILLEPRRGWTTFGQMVAGFCILGAVEALWIFLAHWLNVPASATALLGGIMGAIFTAGGIVVAMVSLYTLSTVARTARSAVREELRRSWDKFDQRMQEHIHAYDRFAQAKLLRMAFPYEPNASQPIGGRASGLVPDAVLWLSERAVDNLNGAEVLIEEALSMAPLGGVSFWAAQQFYETVVREFVRLHAAEPATTTLRLPLEALLSRTVYWLTEALRSQHSDALGVRLMQADAYGMLGDTRRAREALLAATRKGPWAHPRPGWGLACLAHTWAPTQEGLEELGRLIRYELPWTTDRIAGAFRDEGGPSGLRVRDLWAVVKRASGPPEADMPLSPFRMRLCPKGNDEAFVQWAPAAQPGPATVVAGIPAPARDGTNRQEPLPVAAVVEQISERFFIIGEADTCMGRGQ